MIKYLVAIFLILMHSGCNPAKQVARQQKQNQQLIDEYIKNHPQRIDTATKYLPGIEVTKEVVRYDTMVTYSVDTVNGKVKTDTIFYKGKDIYHTKVDTAYKSIYPTDEINLLHKTNAQLTADLAASKLHDASKFNWLWPFIISCIVVTLLTALLIKKF